MSVTESYLGNFVKTVPGSPPQRFCSFGRYGIESNSNFSYCLNVIDFFLHQHSSVQVRACRQEKKGIKGIC